MPQAGFEPSVPATQQAQTSILDRTATGIVWGDPWNLNALLKYIISFNNNNKLSVNFTTILVLND
jgi:hypothetical protein